MQHDVNELMVIISKMIELNKKKKKHISSLHNSKLISYGHLISILKYQSRNYKITSICYAY